MTPYSSVCLVFVLFCLIGFLCVLIFIFCGIFLRDKTMKLGGWRGREDPEGAGEREGCDKRNCMEKLIKEKI